MCMINLVDNKIKLGPPKFLYLLFLTVQEEVPKTKTLKSHFHPREEAVKTRLLDTESDTEGGSAATQ